jgi:Xaa-Pro aminopeptidase
MALPPAAFLEARHARVREVLTSRELDALVVTALANVRYLTSHTGSAGLLVLTAEALHLVADFRYETAIADLQRSDAACPGLRHRPVPGSYDEALIDCLADLGVRAVGFEAAHVSVARHDWLVRTAAERGVARALRTDHRGRSRARA